MKDRFLQPGERVLLTDNRDRRYLIVLATGKQFHSHLGAIDHDDLIGGPEGATVKTTNGTDIHTTMTVARKAISQRC